MRSVFVVTILTLLLSANIVHAQDMYNQYMRVNNKWRVSPGIRIGEPLGLDLFFYKGANCKSRRPWKWDLTAGFDGSMWGDKNKSYGEGQWQSGGFQGSLLYFHGLPVKHFDFINIGIGPQVGTRKSSLVPEGEFVYGFAVAVNSYLIGFPVKLAKNDYLEFTLMIDLRYSYEIPNSFGLFRPSFVILIDRLN